MCGFSGFAAAPRPTLDPRQVLARMNDAIAPRGPDSEGLWVDERANIGFAHRRLAIIDLSAAGAQPMSRGPLTIAYNGEIYNHLELREELARAGRNIDWVGHSDTETLLQGFTHWGVEETLRRATGMFAFALWDDRRRVLSLARDRFGEKPLYYGYQNGVLLFGSDVAALRQHPAFAGALNEEALPAYLRYQYIPAPWSIYRGIFKLPQAGFIEFGETELRDQSLPQPRRYWSLTASALKGKDQPFKGDFAEAKARATDLLKAAVRGQMLSDVPLGAFLSGGIDSSCVVSVMQSVSSQPVHTYTIGSEDGQFDESAIAKRVAAQLGTHHTELIVKPEQVLSVIPNLPNIYSEPFADSSQIPTALVSAMARKHVTVVLTGDAGDEVFGGYNRYVTGTRLWSRMRRIPSPLRALSAGALGLFSEDMWDRIFDVAKPVLPGKLRFRRPGMGISKVRHAMGSPTADAYYHSLVSRWQSPDEALRVGAGAETALSPFPPELSVNGARFDLAEKMMIADMQTYMCDDVLVKVDRAAMASSLETRVPYLDHRLVEFMLSLPSDMKVGGGVSKRLLRAILADYVPASLYDQPKTGFGVPIGRWLRGPLRDWASDLLDPQRLEEGGIFRPAVIQRLWDGHLRGGRDADEALWPVLMFQAWQRAERKSA